MQNMELTGRYKIIYLIFSLITELLENFANLSLLWLVYNCLKLPWTTALLATIIIPLVIIQIISVKALIELSKISKSSIHPCHIISCILPLGLVPYILYFLCRPAVKSGAKQDVRQLHVLQTVKGTIGGAPRLVIVAYLLINFQECTTAWFILDFILLIVTSCWWLSSVEDCIEIGNFGYNVTTITFRFIWRLAELATRIAAVAIFATAYNYFIFLVICLHMFTVLLWLVIQTMMKTTKTRLDHIRNIAASIVYVFVYVQIKEKSLFRFYSMNIITILENIILFVAWYISKSAQTQAFYKVFLYSGPIFGGIFLLILLMIVSRLCDKKKQVQKNSGATRLDCIDCKINVCHIHGLSKRPISVIKADMIRYVSNPPKPLPVWNNNAQKEEIPIAQSHQFSKKPESLSPPSTPSSHGNSPTTSQSFDSVYCSGGDLSPENKTETESLNSTICAPQSKKKYRHRSTNSILSVETIDSGHGSTYRTQSSNYNADMDYFSDYSLSAMSSNPSKICRIKIKDGNAVLNKSFDSAENSRSEKRQQKQRDRSSTLPHITDRTRRLRTPHEKLWSDIVSDDTTDYESDAMRKLAQKYLSHKNNELERYRKRQSSKTFSDDSSTVYSDVSSHVDKRKRPVLENIFEDRTHNSNREYYSGCTLPIQNHNYQETSSGQSDYALTSDDYSSFSPNNPFFGKVHRKKHIRVANGMEHTFV